MALETDSGEGLHFLDYWQVIAARKEIVIAVALLMIAAGIVITRSMPRVYQAACLIQVQRETPDISLFEQRIERYDPYFLRTQFQLIQSTPVIEEVVRELNLTDLFGRAYNYLEHQDMSQAFERTVNLVSSKMKVQQFRDTDLIEIRMLFDKPEQPEGAAYEWAARTANMVARVFKSQTQRRIRETTQGGLAVLEQELAEQDRRIREKEAQLDEIREKYQISDIGGYDAEVGRMTAQILASVEMERTRAEIELQRRKVRYEQLMAITEKNNLIDVLPSVVQNESLNQLIAEKRTLEIRRSTLLRSALGANHPKVIQVSAEIDELNRKINELVEAVKMGMKAELDIAQEEYARLDAMATDLKRRERTQAGSGYREYQKTVQDLKLLRERRNFLDERYIRERINMRIPHTTVNIVQDAKLNINPPPVSPNFPMNIILSVVAGLVSGVALAYFVEYLDTSIKTVEDVEKYLKTRVLGIVPQKVRPLNDPNARVTHSEAYRVLRTNVKSSRMLGDGRAIGITSASVGEGKSLTIFNLAWVTAQLGEKTLLVDADLHRPRQHKMLGLEKSPGLCNLLLNEVSLEECIRKTAQPNLDLLPSGKLQSGSVHGLLDTELMEQLVASLKQRYDWILFDSPPIIGVSDASQLVRITDATVMVVQHRKYPRSMARRAKDMIENMGGNLLGVVLNNINLSRDYTSYYYKYQYYYYPYGDKKGRSKA